MSQWLPEILRPRATGARRGTRLQFGLDQQLLAWVEPSAASGFASLAWRDKPARQAWPAQAFAHTDQRRTRIAQADVVAGNDLAVYWVQSPPASLSSFAELQLIAQHRCAHLFGGSANDWWISADWQENRPFVCTALPMDTVQALDELLAGKQIKAQWQTMWGCIAGGALAGVFPNQGWCCLQSPKRALVWYCHHGRVQAISNLQLATKTSPQAAAAQVRQWIQAEAARADYGQTGPVHWLGLGEELGSLANDKNIVPVKAQALPKAHAGALPQSEAAAAVLLTTRLQKLST